jgi:hypothetical protein
MASAARPDHGIIVGIDHAASLFAARRELNSQEKPLGKKKVVMVPGKWYMNSRIWQTEGLKNDGVERPWRVFDGA